MIYCKWHLTWGNDTVSNFLPETITGMKKYLGLDKDETYIGEIHFPQVVAKAKINYIFLLINEIESRTK